MTIKNIHNFDKSDAWLNKKNPYEKNFSAAGLIIVYFHPEISDFPDTFSTGGAYK
jgi:hypothetical protein